MHTRFLVAVRQKRLIPAVEYSFMYHGATSVELILEIEIRILAYPRNDAKGGEQTFIVINSFVNGGRKSV